jgi:hypothetical protein
MGRGRWILLGAGAASIAALLAAAASFALQSPERDWGPEARAAAQKLLLERAPDRDAVEFVDVEVRRNGNDDERWICGSFAVRDKEGALGPFQDFWVTVAKVPETAADIQDVRANEFGRDDFYDQTSAHFRACFAEDDMG